MEYPRAKHKLPELFEEVIRNDNNFNAIKKSDVIHMDEFKWAKNRKRELIDTCDKYVQKQKGGNVS